MDLDNIDYDELYILFEEIAKARGGDLPAFYTDSNEPISFKEWIDDLVAQLKLHPNKEGLKEFSNLRDLLTTFLKENYLH